MAEISVGGGGGPTRPKPKPTPVSRGVAAITAPVQHAAHTITHAVVPPRPAPVRHVSGSDAASSGPGYGSSRANAYKKTPAYAHAVQQVFAHQSVPQKAAIIAGTRKNYQADPYTARAIVQAMDQLPIYEKVQLNHYLGNQHGIDLGSLIKNIGGALYSLTGNHPLAGAYEPKTTGLEKLLTGGGKAAAGLIQDIPTGIGQTNEQRAIANASGLGPGQIGKNFLKDAVNLPAEALPSVAIPIQTGLQGHWGQALHMAIDPYVQAFKHPQQALAEHPLNTYLMFGGLLHPGTRALDEAQTLARTGRRPNLKAEPVRLTANLTHERPDFSKYPLIRHNQRTIEKQLYKRNRQGELVPRSETARAHMIKIETSRLVGQNERVRRVHREQQMQAHAKAVVKSRGRRLAHGVATAAKYNPEPALIPGADVLARIADGTIRRPDTVAQDLERHIQQVAANRPALAGNPHDLAAHDAYIAELQKALKNKAFLKDPKPAFEAAQRYAREYASLEKAAHKMGHFRDMTADALERRALAHHVLTHMEGAGFDRELGLTANGRKLTTDEMRRFAARETGGRKLAFTSDASMAKADEAQASKSYYVSGQRRPMVARQGNTYFNFTHGLTSPSHEALLEQRVRTQGIVDAHNSMNRLADQLLLQNERTGKPKAWGSYSAAERDAPPGYVPIRLAQPFHPPKSLAKALETGGVDMRTLEEEAASRSLDINSRLQKSSEPGQYGLIDQHAANQLKTHEAQISPGVFFRGFRGLTNQFRTVALATSFRHLPGVVQEQLIRAAMEGAGVISAFAGRAALKRTRELNPRVGEERQIQLTGGGPTGQALSLRTRQTSTQFRGTPLEAPLSAFEKFMRAPGPRQMRTAWRTWTHFTLDGTKRLLEENTAYAAVGKQVIADFGGRHGLLALAMGKWGKMVDEAAHGILDEGTARQLGAYVRRVYGRWTDLTPEEQSILMFSPFGMWWTNSVAWLARMPVDHPVGAAFMAGLNTGTEKQRQKLGLDMFSPGHLPLYQQGGILAGGHIFGQNYYTAFGVANDPGETAASLFLPWQNELYNAFRGKDWKGETINSPANPKGNGKPPWWDIATVVANSVASSFVPLYTKAQTIVQGGASSYDTSTFLNPQTKGPNPGPLAGLEKAVSPLRSQRPATASSSGSSSGGWGSGAGSSSGGWGVSGSNSGGWG